MVPPMRKGTAIPSRITGMVCPGCQSPTRVLESRRAPNGGSVRRRRECSRCGHRFTTFERRELEPLHIIKRDGQLMRPRRLASNLYQFRPGTGAQRCILDCIAKSMEKSQSRIAGPGEG